jgi:2-dehydropantoate 2-reductase
MHRAALEPLAAAGVADAFVSLGNGLIQDRLAALVGRDRLLSCLVEWAGTNLGPGRVVRDTVAPMVVGELDGVQRERTHLLARCLEAVGDVRMSNNIQGMIWSKLLVNTTFTGLSAVSGLRYGAVADHPEGREVAFGIWTEGVAVSEAEGRRLERVLDVEPHELTVGSPTRDDALARMMAIAGNSKPSMLQDLEQGRPTEIEVVNGGVARRGRAHGIPTPLNDHVVELVRIMETGERVPHPDVFAELLARPRAPAAARRA